MQTDYMLFIGLCIVIVYSLAITWFMHVRSKRIRAQQMVGITQEEADVIAKRDAEYAEAASITYRFELLHCDPELQDELLAFMRYADDTLPLLKATRQSRNLQFPVTLWYHEDLGKMLHYVMVAEKMLGNFINLNRIQFSITCEQVSEPDDLFNTLRTQGSL